MNATILGIISSVCLMIIGLWKYFGRKNQFKREQAEQAKKDVDNANANGNPSDFLDGFGRV